MGAFWKRVLRDWWAFVRSHLIIGYVVVPILAFFVTASVIGIDRVSTDVWPIASAFLAALAVSFLAFLWVVACTPRNIEKDRADALHARVQELESGARLPEVLIRTLSDSQSTSDHLNQKLITVSVVIEQYRRLFASALGRDDDHGDLRLIASSLCDDTGDILPKLPFRPQETISWLIGWNRYRYLFDVPKSRVPDVDFVDLQEGVSGRVVDRNKIRFDAEFYHSPSNNRDSVAAQAAFINARLGR